MATYLGGMPPMYHLPRASSNPTTSTEGVQRRLFGPKDAAVSAASVEQAQNAAKKTIMNFLDRRGESAEYARLTSLTGF